MKKSEIYKMAQIAVLNSGLHGSNKLEILRELMAREDLEQLMEQQKEKEKAE